MEKMSLSLMSESEDLLPWPRVSDLAKDFISGLLRVDPCARLSADQALQHPWVSAEAPASSAANLHRPISQNLRLRASRGSCGSQSSSGRREQRRLHSQS
uniref:Uncharacterized protein n=1 Tax=Knipowitschia caucasica TaxID=637954 RepID=A0AAV2L1H2_KNICA